MKTGVELIAEERQRHFDVEGWTLEHDKANNTDIELAAAGGCYALAKWSNITAMNLWPWDLKWFKCATPITSESKEDKVRRYQKAGALIAAAIDRLQND